MARSIRSLVPLIAGVGMVAMPAWGDPGVVDQSPISRRYEVIGPNGSKRTVIELMPATEPTAPHADVLVPADDPPVFRPPVKPEMKPDPGLVAAAVEIPTAPPVAGSSPLHLWAEADWLNWWYRGTSIPPLVTAGSPLDPIPGALGESGTRILYGGQPSTSDGVPGGRLRLGGWSPGTPIGWEVGGFYTQPQETSGAFTSNDVAVLARPFVDTFATTPGSILFGAPGAFTGAINTHTRTSFWGLEANGVAALDTDGTLAGFAGYRYLQMSDDLAVVGRYTLGAGGLAFASGISLATGATGLIGDQVKTKNEFNGGQLGLKWHACYGRLAFDVRGSLAVGVGSERIHLEGETNTVDATGTVRQAPFGVLVQASNAGQYGRDLLTVVPEVGAKVSFSVAPGVSVHAGYDFLYWASVARAADQLDGAVDTRQMPSNGNFTGGPGFRPVSPLRDTSFWAQGFNVGVRVDY